MERKFTLSPLTNVVRQGYLQALGPVALTYTLSRDNAKQGTSNPGWSKRIKDGAFVASPYLVDRVDVDEYNLPTWEIKYSAPGSNPSSGRTVISGLIASPGTILAVPDDPYLPAQRSKALSDSYNRLLAKIREENSETNGLLMLGELRETIKMLRRPARALEDAFKLFTSRTKREAALARTRRAFMKAYSGLYLEWAYGWAPLSSDITDLCRTYVRHATEVFPRKRVTGSSDPIGNTTSTSTVYTLGQADTMHAASVTANSSLSARSIAYLRPSVTGEGLQSAQRLIDLAGFTVENFIPTVYNLIPFSFLLDYVSNLGDVIEGATTCQQNVTGGVTTVRTQSRRYVTVSRPPQADSALMAQFPGIKSVTASAQPAIVNLSRNIVERTTFDKVPVPDLLLTLPGGKQSFNMVTLVIGFASGVSPPRR